MIAVVQIKSLILKEFGRVKSDKRSLIMLVLLPLVTIIIFGLSTGGGPQMTFNVSLITNDYIGATSPSNYTYDSTLIDAFQNSSSSDLMFSLVVVSVFNSTSTSEYAQHLAVAKNQMNLGLIDAIVIIPENFSEDFGADNDTILECVVDASQTQYAAENFQTVLQLPIMYFRMETEHTQGAIIFLPYLEFDVPLSYSQLFNYMASMILPIALLGTTMNLTALCIVTEGPLPRMLITPAGKRDVILSKLITYTTLMIMQATIVFITASAFNLYSAGPLFDLFISLILVGFAGTSIGLLISAVTRTEHQANQIYIFAFILFTLLGGLFISVDALPLPFQIVIYCLPMAHCMPLVSDITLRGISYFTPMANINLLFHSASLLLISGVCIVAALVAYRIKKTEV